VPHQHELGPENPFPAALESAYQALSWLSEHGAELGGDPSRIAVMGDSAGGNLAAALCLLAERRSGPRPAAQILIYPALDATLSTPRMRAESAARRRECQAFYGYYAGNANFSDELVSPLLAENLERMPQTLVITADHDALCDDGWLYAQRLREAGVSVRYSNYLGAPHGFLSMPRLCNAAAPAIEEVCSELRSLT
jgi:acetyl esterase/lipase